MMISDDCSAPLWVQVSLLERRAVRFERRISTTVIQGDRDSQGTTFSQLTTAFR